MCLLLIVLSDVSWCVIVNGLLYDVEIVFVSLIFFVVIVSVDSMVSGLKWFRKCGIDFLLM